MYGLDPGELAHLISLRTIPYSEDALEKLHPFGWLDIPVSWVLPESLTPTQSDVAVSRLLHHKYGGSAEAGDYCIHVVAYEGRLYIHDGHHRWTIAMLLNSITIPARIVDEFGFSFSNLA